MQELSTVFLSFLCNLVMEELLRFLDHNLHKILRYADHFVILAQEKYNIVVRGRMLQALIHLSPRKRH